MNKCKLKEKLKLIYETIVDWFLLQPKRLVRLIVLSGCSIIVFFQLSECFYKLINPPISTLNHFDLNQSMYYPAVTFCRDPPFKLEVMEKYNLSFNPAITDSWKRFPFATTTLEEFFEEATYTKEEYFIKYSLANRSSAIDILPTLTFNLGRCYTVNPKTTTKDPWKKSGYNIILKHDYQQPPNDSNDGITPGWHVYIHEPSEKFTERGMQKSGRVEYMFVEMNEVIEIKLTVQHFTQLRGRGSTCSDDFWHSTSVCGEICKWDHVVESVGCIGPWMNNKNVPQCTNYQDTKNLIITYNHFADIDDKECFCIEPCYSIIYSAFVVNRQKLRPPRQSSQMYLYYTSKMVTNIEERPGYDVSQFVADMGGSLGFLLGLSVLGLIVVLEKLLGIWFMNKLVTNYKNKKLMKQLQKEEQQKQPEIKVDLNI